MNRGSSVRSRMRQYGSIWIGPALPRLRGLKSLTHFYVSDSREAHAACPRDVHVFASFPVGWSVSFPPACKFVDPHPYCCETVDDTLAHGPGRRLAATLRLDSNTHSPLKKQFGPAVYKIAHRPPLAISPLTLQSDATR